MSSFLKVGMIGLDTSHAPAFTKILNDSSNPHHVPGLKIVAAFPGGSPGLDVSASRVEKFTTELRDDLGVPIVGSIEELPADLDAIFLNSVDGRQHLEQFEKIAGRKVPVFIDKPMTTSSADAKRIAELAAEHGTPVMTASAIRYAEKFTETLRECGDEPIHGADLFGPMAILEGIPAYFWYGIHPADMLYAAMGAGCESVSVTASESHDVIVGKWKDGRIASLRGNRVGVHHFGGTLFAGGASRWFDVSTGTIPYYASLLVLVAEFMKTGKSPIDLAESVEIMRFLEAACESRESGRTVIL